MCIKNYKETKKNIMKQYYGTKKYFFIIIIN